MSEPSASKTFIPVAWIIAIAIVAMATAALVSVGHNDLHSARVTAGEGAPQSLLAAGLGVGQPGELRADQARSDQVRASLGALPLVFEANQGQTDPRVKYVARGGGYTLFLTANDAVFALRSSAQPATARKDLTAGIYMHLVGVNSRAQIVAGSELPGKTNYFIGNDRSKWQRGVKQYAAVSYRDVYPGVTLAYHGEQQQLEFDFVVAPGAAASAIALRFSGAGRISTDASGKLTLATAAGNVTLHPPVAYQEQDGVRQFVDAHFVLTADNQVGFALGGYDHSRELVIDPSVSYATYLGGTAEDDGYSIAIDGSGNAYVAGQTKSTDFPTVAGGHATTNAGSFDVFVTKISADGSTLLYSTYVGGTSDDRGNAIALNASGNAFVAGVTSSTDFPTTSGARQTTYGGAGDAFVFELSSSGAALTYSTYLGGSGAEVANGIAVDGSGNSYIVGETNSTDFPTHNAMKSILTGVSNGFVTKLNSTGNALVYSTYLGGSNDFATAVAVDSSDDAYVTGATQNASFPTTAGAFQTTCGTSANCNGGLPDAFVSVFKPDGSGFVYSTFLGGGNTDQGLAIAVDAAGNAYVAGLTESNTDFPTKAPLQNVFGGGIQDAFVSKLNSTGTALVYSTYLGGNQDDSATSIAVDDSGNAYVTGRTASSTFPTISPTQNTLNGLDDAFVSEISSTGSQLVFSTYLGGSLGEDTSTLADGALGGIAVDRTGANIYVTGNTTSTDFPVVAAEQGANGGFIDAFVVKFGQANFSIAATALNPASVSPGASATSTVTVGALSGFSGSVALTCAVSPASANAPTCSFSPTSIHPGTSATLTVATTASTLGGSYSVTVTGTSGGFVHSTTVNLGVSDFTVSASALSPTAVDPGASATSTVTVGALNGFSTLVALTCSIVPATTTPPTCGYSFTSVTPPATSTLTVTSTPSTTPANHTITVTGTAGGTAHSTTVGLTVNGFHITATTPAAVTAGASGTSTVTLTALNGYNLPVNLTCSVSGIGSPPPACSAASFSVNPVTPTGSGVTSTLTITTTAPTQAMARSRASLPAMWLPVAGISIVGMCFAAAGGRRKKLLGFLLLGLVMTTLLLLPSCGGSNGGSGVGGTCAAAPSAPTGLTASSTTGAGTTLRWTAASVGANCSVLGYAIFQDGVQIGMSTTTSFNVTGLSPSTTYSFTVVASDGAGVSPQSAPLSVTGTGGTPAGSYTVTITGTDTNSLSQSTQVTLTVN